MSSPDIVHGGSQKDWSALADEKKPVITIITSTFNAAEALPITLTSIKKQTYAHVQWVIADGGSTDGTVDILKSNEDVIDYWFSAPDAGIYDAWNKALQHAQGDWVQFLGAGDELYSTETLREVAEHLSQAYPDYKLVYGQVENISEVNRQTLFTSGEPWVNYQGKWEGNRIKLPVQTGIYHHKSLFDSKTPFDTTLKITADCKFLIQKLEQCQITYIPIKINKMPIGGISASLDSIFKIHNETKTYYKQLGLKIPFMVGLNNSIKLFIRQSLATVLTEKKTRQLLDFIRKKQGKPAIWTVK